MCIGLGLVVERLCGLNMSDIFLNVGVRIIPPPSHRPTKVSNILMVDNHARFSATAPMMMAGIIIKLSEND